MTEEIDLFEKGTTAYSNEEVAKKFVEHFAAMADYWATIPNGGTTIERCRGLAFSLLSMIDGTNVGMPAFNLTPAPHPDDKKYHQEEGERWFESTTFNADIMLHDMFYPMIETEETNE